MDWADFLRDSLFCLFAILLIIYVGQCCIYERRIERLEKENERLRNGKHAGAGGVD